MDEERFVLMRCADRLAPNDGPNSLGLHQPGDPAPSARPERQLGRNLVHRLARHGPILSGVEASGKPKTVQSNL